MDTFSNNQQFIEDLPQITRLDYRNLDPQYGKLVLISISVKLIIIAAAIFAFFYLAPRFTISWILVFALILGSIIIPVLSWYSAKTKQYALREHDLVYRRGLVWHKTTAVTFNRIQHIDMTSGPLERRLGLCTLKFFTAGGASVDLKLPGLPQLEAEKLRTFILNKSSETEMEDEGSHE